MCDPEIRFETDPGVQTQADWAILGTWPVDGEPAELSAIVRIGVGPQTTRGFWPSARRVPVVIHERPQKNGYTVSVAPKAILRILGERLSRYD